MRMGRASARTVPIIVLSRLLAHTLGTCLKEYLKWLLMTQRETEGINYI